MLSPLANSMNSTKWVQLVVVSVLLLMLYLSARHAPTFRTIVACLMSPRMVLAAVVLVAGCGAGSPDRTTVPPAPDCGSGQPAAVIAASGCTDGDEFQTVAVFTCDNGRRLYGIDNRWAFAGDRSWTIGGQPLWDDCRNL